MKNWIEKQKFIDGFKYGMGKENLYGFSDISGESEFSNRTCEICGSHLAGSRYTVTGNPIDPNTEPFDYEICPDCLYYSEYGQLDNMSELEILDSLEAWEAVQCEIKEFLAANIDKWKSEAVAYFEPENEEDEGLDAMPCMDLTVATDSMGSTWSYQTGDNSFTGNAYGLPVWAVVYVTESSTIDDLYSDIIGQFEEAFFS